MSSLDLPALKKPITKRFVNAKLSDVLAWLSLEQFSFVADAGEFPDQSQVTLNFRNQPLGAVLDAIADGFNGRWERRGDIFTLRPGRSANFALGAPAVADIAVSTAPFMKSSVAPAAGKAPTAVVGEAFSPKIAPLAARTFMPKGSAPMVAPSVPLMAPRAGALSGVKDLPVTAQETRVWTVPAIEGRAFYGSQDPKAHEEAMRQAERALREAEEHIRKLHESGEWRKHMERAMAEARSQHGSEAHRKAVEEAMRAVQNMPNSDAWKRAFEEARQSIQKALESGKVTVDGKERPMTGKEREHLEKSLQHLKEFKMPEIKLDQKMFKELPGMEGRVFAMPHGPDMKKFEEMMKNVPDMKGRVFVMPQGPDMKKFEEMMKNMPDMKGRVFVMPQGPDMKKFEEMMKNMPDMKGRVFTFPEFHRQDADRERRIQERIRELRQRSGVAPKAEIRALEHELKSKAEALKAIPRGKVLEGGPGTRGFAFDVGRMRIKELLESLTTDQLAKQEKQGHLTLEDLTPKQREMLGGIPKDSNWTFVYAIDGKKLTLKGK
jgi:hypothetical protein